MTRGSGKGPVQEGSRGGRTQSPLGMLVPQGDWLVSTDPLLIPDIPNWGAHGQDAREGGAPAMSTRQKPLLHGVMEPSPQGDTPQLPSQRDAPQPSC